MGCFNATCMVSNLPINYGDKIKLVLLRPNYSIDRIYQSGGYVYNSDVLTPSFLPISGTYNDYGMIENIEMDWNYKTIELILKKTLGDTIKVNDKIKSDYDLLDILNGISANSLWYTGVDPEEVKKKEMAQNFCNFYREFGYPSETAKLEWERLLNLDISEEERQFNFSFVMIREDIWNHIVDNYVGECYNPNAQTTTNVYISLKEWCKYEYETNKSSIFSRNYAGSLSYYAPKIYNSILSSANEELEKNIFNDWTSFEIINSYLAGTRKGWMVQPGLGSQYDGWADYKILSEKIIEICNNKLKK